MPVELRAEEAYELRNLYSPLLLYEFSSISLLRHHARVLIVHFVHMHASCSTMGSFGRLHGASTSDSKLPAAGPGMVLSIGKTSSDSAVTNIGHVSCVGPCPSRLPSHSASSLTRRSSCSPPCLIRPRLSLSDTLVKEFLESLLSKQTQAIRCVPLDKFG